MYEWQGHRPGSSKNLAIFIGAGSPGCESFLGGVGGEKDSDARETHGNTPCGLGREPGALQFDPI